jgi:heterodisulfide reductase subunit D
MWKEEEAGELRVSEARMAEARVTGQSTLAVGCPFCMVMLSDAAGTDIDMQVKDVAELLAEQLESTGNSSIDRSIVAENADHP